VRNMQKEFKFVESKICKHIKKLPNGCHICDLTVNHQYPLYTYCDREMAKVLKCKFYKPGEGGDIK